MRFRYLSRLDLLLHPPPTFDVFTVFESIHRRAVAEKEEFVLQWEEDVDALRLQLGAERTRREEDRRDLEEAIFDLEDELEHIKVFMAVVATHYVRAI